MLEVALVEVDPQAACHHRPSPFLADVAELGHLPQDLVAAGFRRGRLQQRVVFGGSLGEPRQQRRFGQLQLRDGLGEEDLRGGADPHRGRPFDRPVGGDVEVGAEDFPAAVALGVLDRQLRLFDLALEVALRVLDAEVADQLLGDRRAALDRFARFQVLDRGAQDPLVVEAVVLVEALVLDRHRRQLQALRDAVDRDQRASLRRGYRSQLRAVGGVDYRVAALVDRFAAGERGGVGGDVEDPGGDGDGGDREQGEDAAEDDQELGADPPMPALASPSALRHRTRGYFASSAVRRWCLRSSGCGRPLRSAAGWGSPRSCRRRGRRRCRRG